MRNSIFAMPLNLRTFIINSYLNIFLQYLCQAHGKLIYITNSTPNVGVMTIQSVVGITHVAIFKTEKTNVAKKIN